MSSKARSLRERMSIDPDAPTPVTERRPRSRAAEAPAPRGEERPEPRPSAASTAPEPADEPVAAEPAAPVVRPVPASPPVEEPTPVTPEVTSTDGAAHAAPAEPDPAPRETPSPPKRSSSRAKPARPAARRTRRSGKDGVDWETALDDPAISAGGNGYRSFYVSDEVFARFRAAVYWTARRPDVDDVPDNMSVGIEDYMDSVATDLERRFNDKAVFPPTPDQVRAHRKRENRS